MAGLMSGNDTDYLTMKQILRGLDIYWEKFNIFNNGKQYKDLM